MSPSLREFGDTHALKCELASEVLRSSGKLRLQVTGWSMLPSVWPGDTLVVERVTNESVSAGDIVLFGRDRRLFAHRVVTRARHELDSAIVTRGDAMPAADPPIEKNELLGRVSHILREGRFIKPSRSLRLSERAVAALARRSEIATRVIVGVHGMRRALK